MRLERTYLIEENEAFARSRISIYFEKAGFSPVSTGALLVYRRGSVAQLRSASPPRKWPVTAAVQIQSSLGQASEVWVRLDIMTRGQVVTPKERQFWEDELDGLARNLGVSLPPSRRVLDPGEVARQELRLKRSANWFFWIAGLSIYNSLTPALSNQLKFVIGLGTTQLIDQFAQSLAARPGIELDLLIRVGFLILDFLIASLFILFGLMGHRRSRPAFLAGMALYALDGLIFIIHPDILSLCFHLLALWGLSYGLQAIAKLNAIEQQLNRAG